MAATFGAYPLNCCIHPPNCQSPQESRRETYRSISIVILFVIGALVTIVGLGTIGREGLEHLTKIVIHPLVFCAIGLAVFLWYRGSRTITDLNDPVPEGDIFDLKRFAATYGMKAWCQHELSCIQSPNWLEFKDLYARMAEALMTESRYVLGYHNEKPTHDLSEPAMSSPARPPLPLGPRSSAKAAAILFGVISCIAFTFWVLQFFFPYEQDTTYINLYSAGILALISGFFIRGMVTSSNDVPLRGSEALNIAQYARQLGVSNQLRSLLTGPVHDSNTQEVLDLIERQVFNPAPAKVPV